MALLEIGSDQGMAIAAAVRESLPDWSTTVERDLAGHPRVARVEPPTPRPAEDVRYAPGPA